MDGGGEKGSSPGWTSQCENITVGPTCASGSLHGSVLKEERSLMMREPCSAGNWGTSSPTVGHPPPPVSCQLLMRMDLTDIRDLWRDESGSVAHTLSQSLLHLCWVEGPVICLSSKEKGG